MLLCQNRGVENVPSLSILLQHLISQRKEWMYELYDWASTLRWKDHFRYLQRGSSPILARSISSWVEWMVHSARNISGYYSARNISGYFVQRRSQSVKLTSAAAKVDPFHPPGKANLFFCLLFWVRILRVSSLNSNYWVILKTIHIIWKIFGLHCTVTFGH